jgi:hypothetical protein
VAISFSCVCGQNLRVDDNWAGGSLRCAGCGCLVRVPSAPPANEPVGSDATQTITSPAEVVPPVPVYEVKMVEVAMVPPNPLTLRPERAFDFAKARRKAQPWPLEKHWDDFPHYPIRALPRLFCLALAWATVIKILVALLPDDWTLVEFVKQSPLWLALFLLLGHTVNWLAATFAAAIAGRAGYIARPTGRILSRAVRGGLLSLYCFLAGPIVPATVAVWFWLDGGDFEWVDWLIWLELWTLALAYWTLALLAFQEYGRLRDVSPVAIVKLVRQLGYRVAAATLFISIILIGHAYVMLHSLREMHRGLGGWFFMLWCWVSLLFFLVLILRWLGVSCFQAERSKR